MNEVSADEIRKIATLGRLHLEDEEVVSAAKDLSGVLGNFETIKAIDTTGVAPADDVSGLTNIVREDVVQEGILAFPDTLRDTARVVNGYVQVRGVFSEHEVS